MLSKEELNLCVLLENNLSIKLELESTCTDEELTVTILFGDL